MEKFSAKEIAISELFEDKIRYRIPAYQRAYSWDKDYISNFWNYINDDADSYFLGTVVLNSEYLDSEKMKDIVDGQQRLITTVILLSAIRDHFFLLGDQDSAKYIQKEYIAIENRNGKDAGYRLMPGASIRIYFEEVIQKAGRIGPENKINGKIAEEKRVLTNYTFFWESISSVLKEKGTDEEKICFLENLRDSLLDLQIVRIEVKSEDDAYIFFESINATGMKLSSADILKNLLFKKTTLDAAKLADRWNELLDILGGSKGDPDITRYLRNYWLSRHEKVSKGKIYLSVKNSIDRKDKPLYGGSYDNFLTELIDKAKLYKQILRPNEDELTDLLQDAGVAKRVTRGLKGIRILGVVQPYPLLLSLLDKLRNPGMHAQSAISLFATIEHFTFVYSTVSGKIPSKLEKIYSNFAIQIANAQNHDSLSKIAEDCRKKLSSEFPKKEEFDANISDFRYGVEKKGTLYYLLGKIAHGGGSEFTIDNVDIEHVFPQNPQNQPLDENETKAIDVVNDLGNLILVNPHLNKKAGNKRITEKIKVYSESAISNVTDLIQEVEQNGGVWGHKQINARTKALRDKAWSIFSKGLV